MSTPTRTIRTRENRQSFKRFCRILRARHGSAETYGTYCGMFGDISGAKWRFPDLSLVASLDITRPIPTRDEPSGSVLITLYHPRHHQP